MEKGNVAKESHVGTYLLNVKLFLGGFYWLGMHSDCERVCATCQQCLRYNVGRVGIMGIIAELPMDHIAIDHMGPFPTSENGFNFVLLVVDIATKSAK